MYNCHFATLGMTILGVVCYAYWIFIVTIITLFVLYAVFESHERPKTAKVFLYLAISFAILFILSIILAYNV